MTLKKFRKSIEKKHLKKLGKEIPDDATISIVVDMTDGIMSYAIQAQSNGKRFVLAWLPLKAPSQE